MMNPNNLLGKTSWEILKCSSLHLDSVIIQNCGIFPNTSRRSYSSEKEEKKGGGGKIKQKIHRGKNKNKAKRGQQKSQNKKNIYIHKNKF